MSTPGTYHGPGVGASGEHHAISGTGDIPMAGAIDFEGIIAVEKAKLTVKEEALKPLARLLEQEPDGLALRIAVLGGPNGPGLGLVVDEPGDRDLRLEHQGIPLIIDRQLLEYCGTITIGYTESGAASCGAGGGAVVIEPATAI